MEAYTYSNLFDTKGIEYIVIIFFLLLLIPFWLIVNRKSETGNIIQEAVKVFATSVLSIPKGLFYSRNHAWLYLEKSGQAKIGIDDFLLKVLGKVNVVPSKSAGEYIKKGDVIALIEKDGKKLKIHSPVSGEIFGFNSELKEDATSLSADPYGDGWLYIVQPENWKNETSGFFLGNEVMPWMDRELQRLKDFLNVSYSKYTDTAMALVYQEGGELQQNPLADLETAVWDDFQNEFLEQIG
jgi:glycine cleavage system H protein